MVTTTKIRQPTTITLDLDEVRRLYTLSTELADATEDMLENQGTYAPEFITGLRQSLKEAKEGKLHAINSLADIS